MDAMCAESLPPDLFETWEKISAELKNTRTKLLTGNSLGLPVTAHQMGDIVDVTFGDAGVLKNCRVVGVRYKDGGGSVFLHFDLRVVTHIDDNGKKNYAPLYNIPNGLVVGRS